MKRFWLATVAMILAAACSESPGDDDDDDGSSSQGAGGTQQGGGGGTQQGGGGTMTVEQCPAVCEKLATLIANEGCPAPTECNCMEPCAHLTNAVIDCLLAAPGSCQCQGNELDCGTTCRAEIDADNACWQAN